MISKLLEPTLYNIESPAWPEEQVRRTTLSALMHTIPQVVATVALFVLADPFTAFVMSLFILAYLPTYIAHWRRWPLLGRVWSPIAGMTTIVAFHIVMGKEWDISMILLSQVVLPFCIFTQQERKLTFLFAMLPALLFVILEGFVSWGPFVEHQLTENEIRWFSMFPPTVACVDIYTRIRLLIDRIHQAVNQASEAENKAVLADRAKSAFLANMSHEIRTPMNAVVGLSCLLKNTQLTIEQAELVENITTSSGGLLRIINDILDYSKIEAGEIDIRLNLFNLHECVENVMSVLALKAQEKEIEFGVVVSHQLPLMLVGDSDRLKQVLFNLIGNALKYTERGHVHLRVDLATVGEKDIVVDFVVSDSGIGIRAEDVDRIFDAFVQTDTSMTRQYGGTGLGLAISKRIVTLLDGHLDAKSTVGEGSEFHFTARFEKQAADPAPLGLNCLKDKQVAIVSFQNANIVTEALMEMLTRLECHVLLEQPAKNGLKSAVAAWAAKQPIDLVIVDTDQPAGEVDVLWEQLSSIPQLAAPRMIVLKNTGQLGGVLPSRNESIDVLFKPLKLSALVKSMENLFSEERTEPAMRPYRMEEDDLVVQPAQTGGRILVVEDNRVNQLVISKMLDHLGYQSELADNGQEAVDILKKAHFDLVLMDHQMPVLDGVSATKMIRLGKTGVLNPGIPIIAVTASAMNGDREYFLDAGMNDYLAKPIVPAVLSELLARWIVKEQMPGNDTVTVSSESSR